MNKTISITGMSCGHCSARVEKALNDLPGVSASVDLDKAVASVTTDGSVDDAALVQAVASAGYEVTEIA